MAEKQKRTAMSSMSEALQELLPYTQLGWQLAASVLLFFGIGYGLDAWLDTGAVFTIILALLGAVFGLVTTIKSALDLERKRKSKVQ